MPTAKEIKAFAVEHIVDKSGLPLERVLALGIGIVGTVIAICASGFPSWAAHLTPWGYYSSASAADYRGEQVVTLNPSYVSIVALGVVGAVLFWLMTVRLDRQEVRA